MIENDKTHVKLMAVLGLGTFASLASKTDFEKNSNPTAPLDPPAQSQPAEKNENSPFQQAKNAIPPLIDLSSISFQLSPEVPTSAIAPNSAAIPKQIEIPVELPKAEFPRGMDRAGTLRELLEGDVSPTSNVNSTTNAGVEVPATKDVASPASATTPKLDVSEYPVLRKGSSGTWVTELQRKLKESGQEIEIDGKFGRKTAESVREFQKKQQLSPDGVVGNATWKLLDPGNSAKIDMIFSQRPRNSEKTDDPNYVITQMSPDKQRQVIDCCSKVAPGDTNFANAMVIILQREGGFTVDHAGDTKYGVTKPFYDEYVRRAGISADQVKAIRDLTLEDAVKAYYNSIWIRSGCKEILELYTGDPECRKLNAATSSTEPLALLIANGAINYGPGRAMKFLCHAINKADVAGANDIGERTRMDSELADALKMCVQDGAVVNVCKEYIARERQHYETLGRKEKYEIYLRGWLNRHEEIVDNVELIHTRNKLATLRRVMSDFDLLVTKIQPTS